MQPIRGFWRDAFAALTPDERHEAHDRAYEVVARLCDKFADVRGLKDNDVYVRKARRALSRQTIAHDWNHAQDVWRLWAWKAKNEVLDHHRKIRRTLAKAPTEGDLEDKRHIESIIRYFEAKGIKLAADAAKLVEYLWSAGAQLKRTKKRGISFKAAPIAIGMSDRWQEPWDVNRVQHARQYLISEISRVEGGSIPEVIDHLRATPLDRKVSHATLQE